MDQRVRVVKEPAPIVTWEEMKTHAKIEEESEKTYVEGLIAGATAWLDGPTGWLGRTIGVQTLEVALDDWPCDFGNLPYGPVIELVSIAYIDPDEVTHDYPIDDLMVNDLPAVRGRMGDVRVRYIAGYGKRDEADATKWVNTPPAPLKVAVLMLAANWYENREAVVVGATVEKLPFAVDALVQPYRVYR